MTTPFDGLGVWSFWFDGVGTPLTAADCQAYKAVGVDWICVKVSDGTQTWGGTPAAQMDLVRQAGMRAIPWGFLYGNLSIPAQLAALQSAGPGPYIMDIEEAVAVGQLAPVAHESAVATWGDPQNFPGQPSIGQLADVGLAAVMPEAYSGAWLLTPAEAIARAVGDYQALHLTNLPPLLPINDSADMLAFAQAAKAAGCSGVSAWRHGANGITPSSLAGVSAVFEAQPPAPLPSPAPTPDPAPSPAPSPVIIGGDTMYIAATPTLSSSQQLNVTSADPSCRGTITDSQGVVCAAGLFHPGIGVGSSSPGGYVIVATAPFTFTVT